MNDPSRQELDSSEGLSRRRFFAGAIAAGTALPYAALPLQSATARPVRSPNEKLDIGVVGVAARGAANLAGVAAENIVALCDIDAKRLDAASKQFPKADRFVDYRQMLDQARLDAVVVSTPDHTHALPVVAALDMGLDVYCEKPLARSVYEARAMREAARRNQAVTQMGTQIHSLNNYRRVVELVQSGVLGPIRRVHVWKTNSCRPGQRVAQGTPPPHVDYDLWVGPAPMRPFHESHFHYNWRHWFDFGGGTLADFGCHYMDLPFWALQLGAPTSVQADGEKTYEGDNLPPDNMRVDYHFPARADLPEVHMTWHQGGWRPDWIESYGKNDGVLFEGEQGRLLADYTTHKLFMEGNNEPTRPLAWIPDSLGHHQEWIAACKSRGGTTCNFEYGGGLTEAVLLGNVSYRAGKQELRWNGAELRADNLPEAASLIRPEYRKPWKLEA